MESVARSGRGGTFLNKDTMEPDVPRSEIPGSAGSGKLAMKIAFGWLVPGGAYLLKRRYEQFALRFTLVCAAFASGIALGGLNNPPQSGAFGVAAAAAKWLVGGPYLIASIFGQAKLSI